MVCPISLLKKPSTFQTKSALDAGGNSDQTKETVLRTLLERISKVKGWQDMIASNKMPNSFFWIWALMNWVAGGGLARGDTDFRENALSVQSFGTHSRLNVAMDPSLDAKLSVTPRGFHVVFVSATFQDLGVPFGAEESVLKYIRGLKDSRVKSIDLSQTAQGIEMTGQWVFPTGEETLADPKMEFFDYRAKNPARFILDFWHAQGVTALEAKNRKEKAELADRLKTAKLQSKAELARLTEALQKRKESEDPGKFCRQTLHESRDVFLPFSAVHQKVDFSRWIAASNPDRDYPYLTPSGDSEVARHVKTAQEFYSTGNYALTLKTIDLLTAKKIEHPFQYDFKFLKANALYKLGREAEALAAFEALIETAPNAPPSLYAGMFLAASSLEKGESYRALQQFLWLQVHYPRHRLAWVFHLGAAEALYELKETDRAVKEYQWVYEKGPTPAAKAEGVMREGDLYMDRKDYSQALISYYRALKIFPYEIRRFPSVAINRAEALYWMGEYDRSHLEFVNFQKTFPANPAGWRATFRIGEIFARREGEENQTRGRSWFLRTVNHYPYSPGSFVARMRLLPCGDHAGFDYKTAKRFLDEEAYRYDGANEVILNGYQDLISVTKVRAYLALGSAEKTLEAIQMEKGRSLQEKTVKELDRILISALRKRTLDLIREGKGQEALALYQRFETILPIRADVDLLDFMLGLSEAATDSGMAQVASNIMSRYELLASPAPGRESLDVGPTRKIASEPKGEPVFIQSQEYFIRAKAMWLEKGLAAKAEILELLEKVQDSSHRMIEKEVLLGVMDQKAGLNESALNHAARADLLIRSEPKRGQTAPLPDPVILYWIASLQKINQKWVEATESLRALAKAQREKKSESNEWLSLGLPHPPLNEMIVFEIAETLEKTGDWGAVATAYAEAVENGDQSNRVLYQYAMSLEQMAVKKDALDGQKNKQKVKNILEKIVQNKENDFWKSLAKEALVSRSREGTN